MMQREANPGQMRTIGNKLYIDAGEFSIYFPVWRHLHIQASEVRPFPKTIVSVFSTLKLWLWVILNAVSVHRSQTA